METAQSEVMREKATPQTLEKLVYLILAYIHYKNNFYSKFQESHSLPAYAGQILPAKLHQKGNQV
jgi:hypothetical protein